MELIGHVARWKRHLIKLIDIPACEEQPPRSRVGPDCFHQLGDLVVAFFLATVKISFDQFIARPIHPLSAIDGAKITPFPCEFLIFHDSPFERIPVNLLSGRASIFIKRPVRPDMYADRKSTHLNSSHYCAPRMPTSA